MLDAISTRISPAQAATGRAPGETAADAGPASPADRYEPAAPSGFHLRVPFFPGCGGLSLQLGSVASLRIGNPAEVTDVSEDTPPTAPPREGSIARGVLVGGVGAALIAAASIGLPHFAPIEPGLLNVAFRYGGLVALGLGSTDIASGAKNTLVRGALLTAGGVASMAAAYGVWGPIGGLTSLCLGLGGLGATLRGLSHMAGRGSQD